MNVRMDDVPSLWSASAELQKRADQLFPKLHAHKRQAPRNDALSACKNQTQSATNGFFRKIAIIEEYMESLLAQRESITQLDKINGAKSRELEVAIAKGGLELSGANANAALALIKTGRLTEASQFLQRAESIVIDVPPPLDVEKAVAHEAFLIDMMKAAPSLVSAPSFRARAPSSIPTAEDDDVPHSTTPTVQQAVRCSPIVTVEDPVTGSAASSPVAMNRNNSMAAITRDEMRDPVFYTLHSAAKTFHLEYYSRCADFYGIARMLQSCQRAGLISSLYTNTVAQLSAVRHRLERARSSGGSTRNPSMPLTHPPKRPEVVPSAPRRRLSFDETPDTSRDVPRSSPVGDASPRIVLVAPTPRHAESTSNRATFLNCVGASQSLAIRSSDDDSPLSRVYLPTHKLAGATRSFATLVGPSTGCSYGHGHTTENDSDYEDSSTQRQQQALAQRSSLRAKCARSSSNKDTSLRVSPVPPAGCKTKASAARHIHSRSDDAAMRSPKSPLLSEAQRSPTESANQKSWVEELLEPHFAATPLGDDPLALGSSFFAPVAATVESHGVGSSLPTEQAPLAVPPSPTRAASRGGAVSPSLSRCSSRQAQTDRPRSVTHTRGSDSPSRNTNPTDVVAVPALKQPKEPKRQLTTLSSHDSFPVFEGELATLDAPGAKQRRAKIVARRRGVAGRRSILLRPDMSVRERQRVEKASLRKILRWYRQQNWWVAARDEMITHRFVKRRARMLINRCFDGFACRLRMARASRTDRAVLKLQYFFRRHIAMKHRANRAQTVAAYNEKRARAEMLLEKITTFATNQYLARKEVSARRAAVDANMCARIEQESRDDHDMIRCEETSLAAVLLRLSRLKQQCISRLASEDPTLLSQPCQREQERIDEARRLQRCAQVEETAAVAQERIWAQRIIAQYFRRYRCRCEVLRRAAEVKFQNLLFCHRFVCPEDVPLQFLNHGRKALTALTAAAYYHHRRLVVESGVAQHPVDDSEVRTCCTVSLQTV